jgi:biopolymer transport protein TolR
MSVSVDTGGKGGRKSLNTELNLVPYIDMLTCMVAFLLITAVWVQLARIDVTQKGQAQSAEKTDEKPPETKLVVVINDDGFLLAGNAMGGEQKPIHKKDGKYDYTTLLAVLKEVHKTFPDKRDVHIASDDSVKYQYIIRTMDTALTAQFPDIALTDINAAHL